MTHLSVEASVLTAALSRSAPSWLFHLHFLLILQLQGLHLLNNTGATADTVKQNKSQFIWYFCHDETYEYKLWKYNDIWAFLLGAVHLHRLRLENI